MRRVAAIHIEDSMTASAAEGDSTSPVNHYPAACRAKNSGCAFERDCGRSEPAVERDDSTSGHCGDKCLAGAASRRAITNHLVGVRGILSHSLRWHGTQSLWVSGRWTIRKGIKAAVYGCCNAQQDGPSPPTFLAAPHAPPSCSQDSGLQPLCARYDWVPSLPAMQFESCDSEQAAMSRLENPAQPIRFVAMEHAIQGG